jgi:predicted metal-dependent phosphoesterase TrpH
MRLLLACLRSLIEMMLKADMHMHVKGDPEDIFIKHTFEQLIDHAASLSFDVLAISAHGKVMFSKKLEAYARKKGILLIPGAEANIESKHVLIYNITEKELQKLKTFDDVRMLKKKKDILVIAPHSFYPMAMCLKEKLEENIDVFDAVEICHLYLRFINPNNSAIKIAEKYNKPLVALSDTHMLWMFGRNYTLVDSKKDVKSYISAIKSGKIKPVHRPTPLLMLFRELVWIAGDEIRRLFT